MNHPIGCRCGTLQGYVVPTKAATRAVCYCKDCQAYARFLKREDIVDNDGGTEVVAMLPQQVHWTTGLDALACMSLSDRGILRWYAGCCNTPIGNTPRNVKLPYVGVVHSCLEGASMEDSFGPLRMRANTESARNKVRATPIAMVFGLLIPTMSMLGARVTGAYKRNPFFNAGSGKPIRQRRVLSSSERERAYRQEG